DGGGPRPADQEVRARVRARHVVDERDGLDGQTPRLELFVPRRDLRLILAARLVQDLDAGADLRAEDLQRLRYAQVESVGPLRSAGHQDAQPVRRRLGMQVVVEERAADRVAEQMRLAGGKRAARLRKGGKQGLNERPTRT